jgi:predicted DNA-binding protein
MRDKKLSIELPQETYEWVKDAAKNSHRSVSGQVRFFLDSERLTNDGSERIRQTAEAKAKGAA